MDAPGTDVTIEVAPLPPGFDRWQELLDLILGAFVYMDGVIDPPSSAYGLTPELLREKAAGETVIVAITDGRLSGCAFLADRGDHAYLGKLAVDPGWQGKGIGRRLVAAAEAEARRQGKRAVELQTRVQLVGNHATFARLGYRETGRTAHEGFSQPTSVSMRKELAV